MNVMLNSFQHLHKFDRFRNKFGMTIKPEIIFRLQSNEFKTKNRSKNKGILGNFHGKWKTATHFYFLNLFNIQGIMYSSQLHFYMIEK
jgi:hypothetical protein